MEQNPLQKTRIEVVDALRGFAVMAIILVHNLEHFIFPVYPADSPEWLEVLDQGVLNVVFSLFAGKAYAIFALLFGFTFYIQTQNQKRRGKDFGYRFLWRMVRGTSPESNFLGHVECRILSGRRCLVAVRCGESGLVLYA